MKYILSLCLALCAVFPVHFAEDCLNNANCNCSNINYTIPDPFPSLNLSCSGGKLSVNIPACQLSANKYNVTSVSLANATEPDCIGSHVFVDGQPQVVLSNPLIDGKCGTSLSVNGDTATYTNRLYIYPETSTIVAKNILSAELNCSVPLYYNTQLNTTLKPKLSTTQITLPGVSGSVTVMMALYKDENFLTAYTDSDTGLDVESFAYISIIIPSLDAKTFAIKILQIYVSGTINPTNYNLTTADGCPNPEYPGVFTIINSGNGTEARFKLKVFKISGEDSVLVKALVTVCLSTCPSNCTSSTSRRYLARSSSSDQTALLAMPLTAAERFVTEQPSGSIGLFSKTSASLLLLMSLIFVKFM